MVGRNGVLDVMKRVTGGPPAEASRMKLVRCVSFGQTFHPPANCARGQEDFAIKEIISKGSFGTVYRIVRKADDKVFALKQVQLKSMTRVDRQEAIDEARLLAKLRNPYIIQHYHSFTDPSTEILNMIMEYASGGTVYHVSRAKGQTLEEGRVWKYLIQSLLGLDYIHQKRIVHRDIKSLNLFLDASDGIKIGDFGIARCLSDGTDMLRTIVGTPFYLSPELCEDRPYNERSDIWALGITLYEMCMGKHPFTAQNEGALIRKIMKGVYAPATGYSKPLLDIVAMCLTYDQRRRPTAAQLLRRADIMAKAKALGISLAPEAPVDTTDVAVYDQPAQPHLVGAQQVQQPTQLQYPQGVMEYPVTGPLHQHQQHAAPQQVPEDHPFYNPAQHAPPHLAVPPQVDHMYGVLQQEGGGVPGRPHSAAFHAADLSLAMRDEYGQPGPAHGLGSQYGLPGGGREQYLDVLRHHARPATAGGYHHQPAGGQPHSHPFALHENSDPYARQAGVGQMMVDSAEARGRHAYQMQARAENVHAGMQDNVRGMLNAYPATNPDRYPQKARPEVLPAAGGRHRPASACAPYGQSLMAGLHDSRLKAESLEKAEKIWSATLERPQYARKRAVDLQITGPSMRGHQSMNRQAPQAAGVYAYAGSEATTTTYIPAAARY